MKLPLVSCIIPVLNGERYLADAIDSILKQSYRRLEIIVVDDGSTDGTAAVIGRHGESVRYFQQENAGTAMAHNLGINAARGQFVAFLDADDLWHRDKLERQMTRFQARPELDYCLAHVQNFWIPELIEEEKKFPRHRVSMPLPGYSTGTLLARRPLFTKVGQFDTTEKHADDTDWFLRASENGAVIELKLTSHSCKT